jgi:shikimate kinase
VVITRENPCNGRLSGVLGIERRSGGEGSIGTRIVTRKYVVARGGCMEGRARAPAAGAILAAFANWRGAAFAIDAYTTAEVRLAPGDPVEGAIEEDPDADTRLIERCVEVVVEEYGDDQGGSVRTESDVPMAAGLKRSSAAANATVLATLDALSVPIDERGDGAVSRADAARLGVRAARETGVSVTGAFDDASASMLGGVTVTDNHRDQILHRGTVDWDVLVWTPPERAYSADADVERCRRIAPVAEFVAETALAGRYAEAMTVNGFAFCAALGFSAEPLVEALPEAAGVSLSGTGPSVTAIGEADALTAVEERWARREGRTWLTRTQNDGARTT